MGDEQYVCMVCGYNMVGYHPDRCPFCGADRDWFLTAAECSRRFRVEELRIHDRVTRLRSVPALGLEHAAYRIRTDAGGWWVDCPSSFDRELVPVDRITFTHHHFLGASNLYRELFSCPVRIHRGDSDHDLCRGFPFQETFDRGFAEAGIEAVPIAGHTPGFTVYFFEDLLFVCDYVLLEDSRAKLNPFGPTGETKAGALRLGEVLEGRELATVCGFRYVVAYSEWKAMFDRLLAEGETA